ncbi:protein SGT1 homolog [Trichonephila inaurata madagascariensis]|uniref:Protein SGT1 homolog n=1 Tax=Trichonephila inaurata madagascariensis TaxID=2747483 RepID=A0A8X6Y811_9ARAC|nr:protein SGT1 homolog [Trichonephila inaurata madagascariensis]
MASVSHPNVKYDWYQTESHVVLNILVKNVKPENVKVDIIDSKLNCTAKLADDSDFSLALHLAHEIQTPQTRWKVLPSKIEIKLSKVGGGMWKKLEKELGEPEKKIDEIIKTYPSSKTQKKDWDKVAVEIQKEEAAEKLEGEAALNELFQKIYADGSDETRKAMNKSFMESGGTVLSTSWNEVAAKKVEVKPPDGMEFKKWD